MAGRGESVLSDVRALMSPDSLCLIGASGDPSKLTGMPLKYLLKHGYQGRLFPVNPKYQEIQGIKCYPHVSALPQPVDVALVSVAPAEVLATLQACAEKGVKYAVVFTAGFAEVGPAGREMQEELARFCRSSGVRLCGPNTNGIINVARGAVVGTCAVGDMDRLLTGRVAVVTQSGGLGSLLTTLLQERGLGFNYYADVGNQADLELSDFVRFVIEDDTTSLVICTIEGLAAPEKFSAVARLARERGKPLIVLKSGRTELGAQAAASHTGALAGSQVFYRAAFAHYGVIGVDTPYAAVDVAQLLLAWEAPAGHRVGIITNTGGMTPLVADLAADLGLELPALSERARREIRQMGGQASTLNPLNADILDEFAKCVRLMLTDEQFDLLVSVMATPVPRVRSRRWAEAFLSACEGSSKPVLVVASPAGGMGEPALELFRERGMVTFDRYDAALQAVAKVLEHWQRLRTRDGPAKVSFPTDKAAASLLLAHRGPVLNEHDSKRLLACYGIPVTQEVLAKNEDEAVEAAQRIGYPVALKVASPDIAHKTEAGGIELAVGSEPELRAACQRVGERLKGYDPGARFEGWLVQEMVQPGVEVAFGVACRRGFPPVLMFGLGGLFVEELRDVAFRAAPLGDDDALAMIKQSRAFPILSGARSRPPADLGACVEILRRLSMLASELGDQIQEIDMNPTIVLAQGMGAKVVDARVVAASGQSRD